MSAEPGKVVEPGQELFQQSVRALCLRGGESVEHRLIDGKACRECFVDESASSVGDFESDRPAVIGVGYTSDETLLLGVDSNRGRKAASNRRINVVSTRASIAQPTTSTPSPAGTPGVSRRTMALIAGVGLLHMAVLAPLAHFGVLENLVVPGDAATTVGNIAADEGLFRLAIAALLVVTFLDIVVAWRCMSCSSL